MATAAASSYRYEPLAGERPIRLVSLHAGNGDDELSIAVEHTSLDQRPAYEALSYVWGSQSPSHPLRCNDGNLAIGENLRAALRHLRKPDAPRLLWIDRIAINQSDIAERAQQVGLMADIYGSASLVVVWLGPADGETESALSLIDGLAVQAMAKTPIRYPPLDAPVWSAVRSFLNRPWFSRVWTFQEIVLAQDALFHCGAHTIGWRRLNLFLLCLKTYSPGPRVEDDRLQGAGRSLEEISLARQFLHQTASTAKPEDIQTLLGLFSLLDGLRNRQASDPRDKVFALLNVADDAKNSDLKPDYSKSHAEVYAMTAKWLLRTQRSLAFLSLVEKKDKPDLISWVPDFRYKDPMNFLHQPRIVFRDGHRIYSATGRTHAAAVDGESTYQLTVRGIYVGSIVERTAPPGNMTNNVAIGAPVLDGGQWHLLARGCAVDGLYPATEEPIDLAYHRLRIWDLLPAEGALGRRKRTGPPTAIPQPGHISYDYAQDALVHGDAGDVGLEMLRKTTRKRMFATETGYMGIGHRSLEIGDRVYMLMGGSLPFVLRPFGGSYYGFGGESYVHGIMDGEMLAIARAGAGRHGADARDLAWIDDLGDAPWPFDTEELVLV